MLPLQNVGVLVTRPEQQAASLCRLLQSQGALAVRLPAIDIKPVDNLTELGQRLGSPKEFDLIVFTSTNAVRFGLELLGRRRDLTLAAIGPATARALDQAGYRVAVTPAGGFDSESLLSHPMLGRLAGRRVLLVRGRHGRELLRDEMTLRGAQVTVADVYERERTQHSAATLEALQDRLAAGEIHIITATSVEIATSLLEMATPRLRQEFDRVHWLVPGGRVAGAIRGRAVTAPILQAATAEDQDLVSALVRWRSSG
ncbi:MAG: uroporphyrinogen-III synthase [Pseudomonadota bacterium]|nr:uroporphyrinogen-III synthase [Pseudomonadota bacterium]